MKKHLHLAPGAESASLPYPCSLVEEESMRKDEREFLYVVCEAQVGSACVGVGAIRFIHVPGYVVSWKSSSGTGGNPVSIVEPVMDESERAAVRAILKNRFPSLQVSF